jgi:hypothetical protein
MIWAIGDICWQGLNINKHPKITLTQKCLGSYLKRRGKWLNDLGGRDFCVWMIHVLFVVIIYPTGWTTRKVIGSLRDKRKTHELFGG